MKKIDAIRAREQAATKGPWLTPKEGGGLTPKEGRGPYAAPNPVDHEGCDVWPWDSEENMVFAYKARTDIPLLLAVERAARMAQELFRAQKGHYNLLLEPAEIIAQLDSSLAALNAEETP